MYDKYLTIILLILFVQPGKVAGQFMLSNLFSDHMVLQRNSDFSFFGTGNPGDQVEVEFNNQHFRDVVNAAGQWKVKIPAQEVGGPFTFIFKCKDRTKYLKDILFGDVWVCSGQSNMEWPISQTNYSPVPEDTTLQVRYIDISIGMDYIPQDSLQGGKWKTLELDGIKELSAVGFHFGKYIHHHTSIPIGLISVNLGATSISPWMPYDQLMQYEQFIPEVDPIIKNNRSFNQIDANFENNKETLLKGYYTGIGMEEKWYLPETNTSSWDIISVPGNWESQGFEDYDGVMWFRTTFDLPVGFNSTHFNLSLNQIDDYDICWVNGIKIGETFGRHNHRNYQIDSSILKPKKNTLVVRVYDKGQQGGFTTSAFWMQPYLRGKWQVKKGSKFLDLPIHHQITQNATPFSSPGVLYNANIAPLTKLPVSGVIWYQGESNAERAFEYRELMKGLISSWREKWNQNKMPFLITQLANHHEVSSLPGPSTWAELRESQMKATELPNTGMACIIDIGEAYDIHPKNKMDVGERLGRIALNQTYHHNINFQGPTIKAIDISKNQALISFNHTANGLQIKGDPNNINGFQVAGKDRKFHWCKAVKEGNKVRLHSDKVSEIEAIRYLWSDNPGEINLYNSEDLPALPFRTDDWEGITTNKFFNYKNARF